VPVELRDTKMYRPHKNKFMNNGGAQSLGQLGQPDYTVQAPPPEEYMTFPQQQETGFQQPMPEQFGNNGSQFGNDSSPFGYDDKEERRKRWMQRKQNKMRGGLQSLDRGKNLWK